MMESFLHWLFQVAGVPPKGIAADAYYGADATFIASAISLGVTVLTGVVVYWFVTRRQQQHMDHMRVSDRLKFIYELEEEFRETIHAEGLLISPSAQESSPERDVYEEILGESDRQQPRRRENSHQLKLFFDLPVIAIDADKITMRPLELGRFLQIEPLPDECLKDCKIAELGAQVHGQYIAVDDRMLSRIGILFHRLDRAMQAQLFSGSDAIAFWKLLRYGGKLYFSFLLHRAQNEIDGKNKAARTRNFDSVFGRYGRIFSSFLLYFQTIGFSAPVDDFMDNAHDKCLELVRRTLDSAEPLPGARDPFGTSWWARFRQPAIRRALANRIRSTLVDRNAAAVAAAQLERPPVLTSSGAAA